MEHIGAVIVTYNPDNKLIELLQVLCKCLDCVVLVDNASSNKIDLKDLQCVFISNKTNLGLATALNQGCEELLNRGYNYCFLFDQDSYLSNDNIQLLINTMKNERAAIVAPRIVLDLDNTTHEGLYITGNGKHISRESICKGMKKEVLVNITSGSLIDLNIWNSVGRFWDILFIEMIDNEYGLRLASNGYKILIDGDVQLIQKLGNANSSKNIGIKVIPTNHSSKRYWYMYRNLILSVKRHGYRKFRGYFNYMFLAFIKKKYTILFFEKNKIQNLKAIYSGFFSGITTKVLKNIQK